MRLRAHLWRHPGQRAYIPAKITAVKRNQLQSPCSLKCLSHAIYTSPAEREAGSVSLWSHHEGPPRDGGLLEAVVMKEPAKAM